jgi:hypothetical protein
MEDKISFSRYMVRNYLFHTLVLIAITIVAVVHKSAIVTGLTVASLIVIGWQGRAAYKRYLNG